MVLRRVLRVKSLTHGFLIYLSDWAELGHLILFNGSVFLEQLQESGSDLHPPSVPHRSAQKNNRAFFGCLASDSAAASGYNRGNAGKQSRATAAFTNPLQMRAQTYGSLSMPWNN